MTRKLWSSKVTGKLWSERRARPAKPVTWRIAGSAKHEQSAAYTVFGAPLAGHGGFEL
ncbi:MULTISPECIES: hypothetical protein [unclassified Bilifractor]|uniref:hypothetical protein n=1 Tax=unclassified Bilifractor TaxID=2815795 RepID=UPI003F908496